MLTTIILFIAILAILVLVHELGHFVVAKLMGIRVDEFGFGLPPRVIGKKIGETIYSLNALPIGGFVRLYGEDEQHPESVKKEKSRAFFSKKPWQKALVLTAGVTMNLILGWFVYTILFTQGVQVPTEKVRVEEISKGSPAEAVGIQKGDIIEQIEANPTDVSPVVHQIKSPHELVEVTNKYLGEEITMTVRRGDETRKFVLTPRRDAPEGEGALGVVITNLEKKTYSLSEAPKLAFFQVIDMIRALIVGLGGMIWKVLTFQSVGAEVTGPVGIGRLVGQARQFGIEAVLELIAILSVNLAVINIAPFPALDGGRLLFVGIEAITGKKVNPRWEQYLHQAGMVVLLFLLLLITINDVLKLGSGKI